MSLQLHGEGQLDKANALDDSASKSEALSRPEPETIQEEQELAKFHAKAKARRKHRQKRVQFQFMFKAGAFVVMLTVVMVTKKIQEWYKGGPTAEVPTPVPASGGEL
mmetsp:Transcript_1827/g.4431  ORF Transcript_1827/g.4431 Transcript_1827/m.4431 type:complete len:107 (-) Transcript_1827:87-407(-)